MIRRPPRSTLFPTRRSSDLLISSTAIRVPSSDDVPNVASLPVMEAYSPTLMVPPLALRSEEHTSELQSQFHLVCRLLLEKKKNLAIISALRDLNAVLVDHWS